MSDYLVRAIAADLQVRAFAATTKELVEHARSVHNTSPVMTAALGRLLTGALMMGVTMKGDEDLLTVKIEGDGPAKGLVVTADSHGNVKGYALNPDVCIPAKHNHKLDVSGAIGEGSLQVIKDIGLKEPYVGKTELVSGEIAEDLTYYYALSEQTPSSVGLGVLMNKDNTVRQAGGIMIQLMPDASEEVISALEERLSKITSITELFEAGLTPENILEELLGDMGLEITDRIPCAFKCNCSHERVSKALISIGKDELQTIIDEGEPIEVGCQFCNTNYKFDVDELKELLDRASN